MRTLASLLALVCTVAACGHRAHDAPDTFHWEEELEPGTTIHLRTATGRIDVVPTDGRSARVSGSTHWVGREDPIRFAWNRDGDDVYVCALWNRHGDCSEGSGFGDSGHSWLDMFSLFKRRSTNGMASLRVELPAGVKVDARSVNGTISMVGTNGGISARTLNGSINIQRASGPIEAKSTNGSIDLVVDSLGAEDPVVIEGVNGSMTAVLPSDLQAEVQLSTVNGGVRSDFPVSSEGELSKHRLRGQIGSSSREVVLKTVNGNVSLLKLPATSGPEIPVTTRPRRGKS
jgi:Putative adhesin